MRRTTRALVATAAGVVLLGLTTFASPAGAVPAEKTTICHGTSSDTNTHVIITISNNTLKNHIGGPNGNGHSTDPGPPGPFYDDEFVNTEGGCGGIIG